MWLKSFNLCGVVLPVSIFLSQISLDVSNLQSLKRSIDNKKSIFKLFQESIVVPKIEIKY